VELATISKKLDGARSRPPANGEARLSGLGERPPKTVSLSLLRKSSGRGELAGSLAWPDDSDSDGRRNDMQWEARKGYSGFDAAIAEAGFYGNFVSQPVFSGSLLYPAVPADYDDFRIRTSGE
jgi:hypothetical protein